GVETAARMEEKDPLATVGGRRDSHADTPERPGRERAQQLTGCREGVVGDAERAGEDVGRATGQCRERRRTPDEAARRFVQRAVAARVLIVGLAPAAHGGNRTGRVFTGDRSGDWLFGSLYRTGFANQPTSVAANDGLELRDAYVAAAVRCAPPENKPTPAERERCVPYLARELALLESVRVAVALGAFAYDALARLLASSGSPLPVPRPRFAHGVVVPAARAPVVGCYH